MIKGLNICPTDRGSDNWDHSDGENLAESDRGKMELDSQLQPVRGQKAVNTS